MNRGMKKINSRRGGINRLVAILLAMVLVMLALISVPAWKMFRYRSEKTGCVQAMKSAKDGLIIEYLDHQGGESEKEAMDALDAILPARPDICPAGGTVYLVRGVNGIFEPVCGLHDDDKKLRVRLNASHAMSLVKDALAEARRLDLDHVEPDSVTIRINGKDLECVRVQEILDLRRGTKLTNGYEGIVCFYGLVGDGPFAAKDLSEGDIAYFVYADENHCARWLASDGWTGDAYRDV